MLTVSPLSAHETTYDESLVAWNRDPIVARAITRALYIEYFSQPEVPMTSTVSPASPSSTTTSSKGLHITLWVLQVLIGLFFVMAGYSHAMAPFDQVVQQAVWMKDVPRALSLFIGYAEIAGGLGLILPAATRIAPWLTPPAALGIAIIMILAIPFHIMRGETSVIWMHTLIAALALFIAWGRWKKVRIRPR
jgi:putative oxidoreductase